MANKSNIYAKIDNSVKDRAMLYITNSKLLDKDTKTLGKLIENSIEEYLINHPL